MNFHFLWHDIQHGLFHFDKGVLYTSKQLFTRPGQTIREFLDGKSVKHFKPISFIIILATVYGILYHYSNINSFNNEFLKGFEEGFNRSTTEEKSPLILNFEIINEWIGTHYSWMTLFLLPFYALASFCAFKKIGYNYVEHLILNSFLTAQRLLFRIATLPLLYFYNNTPTSNIISIVTNIIDFALTFWVYMQFFNKYSKTKSFWLSILSYLFFGLFLLIMINIVVIIFMVYKKVPKY